MMLGSEFSEF